MPPSLTALGSDVEPVYCGKCDRLQSVAGDAYRPPLDLLRDPNVCVKICAPMVRYSKLPFRNLVRKYGCDVAFSPMIVADPFVRSEKAREAEFSTSEDDRPLIVQFGAANDVEFSEAAKLVANVCDGVDLNCGCPQRWVAKKGFGSCLLQKPEHVAEMVKAVKRLPLGRTDSFSVSVKIRVNDDVKKTVNLVQTVERAGVDFVSVHGRTVKQRKEPPNLESIALVKDCVSIPVVANGGMKTLADVHAVHERTGVDGVMAAEGLLDNPAMFTRDCTRTPASCISDYVHLFSKHGSRFNTFHHHLMFMCHSWHPKPMRKVFNALTSFSEVTEFLKARHECLANEEFPVFCEPVDVLERGEEDEYFA